MKEKGYINCIESGEIIAYADKRIYSKNAIMKCLYWYGGFFRANLSLADDKTFRISLTPIDEAEGQPLDLAIYLEKLERDLIDFNLREIVVKETKNVRDLLVAKAFAHSIALNDPPGEVKDPVELAKVNENASTVS